MEIFFVESGRFAPCAIFPKTKQCLRAPRTTSERRVSLKPRHMDFLNVESGAPGCALRSRNRDRDIWPTKRLKVIPWLDFIKKICYNIKKRHFFQKWKEVRWTTTKSSYSSIQFRRRLIFREHMLHCVTQMCSKRRYKCGLGGQALRRPGLGVANLIFLKNYVIIELIP